MEPLSGQDRDDGRLHWGVNGGWRGRVTGDRLALRLRLALRETAGAAGSAGPAAPARRAG